jgi:hypothetical protein
VITAATLLRRPHLGWRRPSRPLVRDDLFQALDAILGEGRDAILTDAIDAQAAVFGEHIDREFVQPVFILAERFGYVADGEYV